MSCEPVRPGLEYPNPRFSATHSHLRRNRETAELEMNAVPTEIAIALHNIVQARRFRVVAILSHGRADAPMEVVEPSKEDDSADGYTVHACVVAEIILGTGLAEIKIERYA